MTDQTTIIVHTTPAYEIRIRPGIADAAGAELSGLLPPGAPVSVFTDSTVAELHYARLEAALRQASYLPRRLVFPAGEASKTLTTVAAMLDFLAESHVSRSDLLVALGGGVTGDLAGFAAAIYLRGIRFVQIPTTLLAMVDSSVGGKTGVDLPAGKNLAGAFHQPSLVLCDPQLLETLPPERMAEGCAEAIKTALIGDPGLLDLLAEADWRGHLPEVIARSVALKARVVAQDEHDHGERQKLNLGHTLGHAVEAATGFAVSHGQAVAIGMMAVARSAAARGLCDPTLPEMLAGILRAHQLPVELPLPLERLLPYLASDKKNSGGKLTLVVPETVGKCRLMPLSLAEAQDFFKCGA